MKRFAIVAIGIALTWGIASGWQHWRKGQTESRKQFEALLKEAQKELARDPKNAYWHMQASTAHAELGHLDLAIKEQEAAIRLDPENPMNYTMAATLYAQMGDLPSEVENLRKALKLDPPNAVTHLRLGMALEKTGRLQEALSEYRVARENITHMREDVYYDARGGASVYKNFRPTVEERISQLERKLQTKR